MSEEAIVDAYNEAEQAVGLHATIDQHPVLPFEAFVLGTPVTVKRVDVTRVGELVAVCHRGRERQAIPILELPLPDPPPAGWEWIEAYRRWARGRW
jgi:calcium binding protein